jgi:hypothetical protein
MTAPIARRRRPRLSFLERRWLLSGKPGCVPFLENGEWARSLWKEYGELITERFLAKPGREFRRPASWWRMERAHDPRRSGESEFDYLTSRPQLLTEAERRRLRAQRQRLDHLQRALDDRSL